MKRTLLILWLFIPLFTNSQHLNESRTIDGNLKYDMIDYSNRKPTWATEFDKVGLSDGVFICRKIISVPHLKGPDTIFYSRRYETYLYTPSGKKISKRSFDDIDAFSEGLARVVVKEPQHDGNFSFTYGTTKMGLINKHGEIIIPLIYRHVWNFKEKLVYVVDSLDRYGTFVNKENREVFNTRFSPYYLTNFQNGVCQVKTSNKQLNFINHKGQLLIPMVYDLIQEAISPRALQVVAKNGKYGLLGKDALLVVPLQYDLIDTLSEHSWQGHYQTQLQGKYGYIDVFTGKEIIPPRYQAFKPTSNTKLWAKSKGKWGLLRSNLNLAYPFEVDSLLSIQPAYTLFRQGNKIGVVDSTGRLIVPARYDKISQFHQGIAILVENDQLGYVNQEGRIIVKPMYSSGTYFQEGKATVKTFWMHYTIDEYHRRLDWGFNPIVYLCVLIGTAVVLLIGRLWSSYHRTRSQLS